jgi:hypothetical protein
VDEGVGSYDGLDVGELVLGKALGDNDGAMVGATVGTLLGIPLGASDDLHSTLQAHGHLAMSSAISSSYCKKAYRDKETEDMQVRNNASTMSRPIGGKHVSQHVPWRASNRTPLLIFILPSTPFTYITQHVKSPAFERFPPHDFAIDVEPPSIPGIVGAPALEATAAPAGARTGRVELVDFLLRKSQVEKAVAIEARPPDGRARRRNLGYVRRIVAALRPSAAAAGAWTSAVELVDFLLRKSLVEIPVAIEARLPDGLACRPILCQIRRIVEALLLCHGAAEDRPGENCPCNDMFWHHPKKWLVAKRANNTTSTY